MKWSTYNSVTKYGSKILLYNSNSDAFLMLSEQKYSLIKNNKNDIINLEKVDKELYDLLVENNFIIDDNYDEKSHYLLSRLLRKFSTEFYHVIVNTTMDCNLNCWYCYENHINNSRIEDEIFERIKKHFVKKIKNEPFRELRLAFFGGEPLLEIDRVVELIKYCKELSKKYNFKLSVDFTTNGTIINNKLLDVLKDINSEFQITFDGDKEKHNKIRYFKKTKEGTYDIILKNIKKILNNLDKTIVRIRINYDLKTLNNIDDLFEYFENVDKNKIIISFHKVWQVIKSVDSNYLISVVDKLLDKGFFVDYHMMAKNAYTCYADNYNQVVINYDGKIYKCTSREFTEENAEGVLNEDGYIIWDYKKLYKRLTVQEREECINCNLYPSCSANCSQNLLDGLGGCVINGLEISPEDYMAYNFKIRLKKIISYEK